MEYTIKILKSSDGLYAFSVNNFQSMKHYFLSPGIKPLYRYAWEAYRHAIHIAKKRPYHTIMSSEEQNELTYEDISAETQIISHYRDVLDMLSDRADGFRDKGAKGKGEQEREIVYEEIKAVVGELLNLKEEVDPGEDKVEIEDIIDDFREVVNDHFSDLLAKDVKEKEEEVEEGEELGQVPGMPEMPDAGLLPPVGMQSGSIEAPLAGRKLNVILRAAAKGEKSLDPELLEDILEHYSWCIGSAVCRINSDYICRINKTDKFISVTSGHNEQLRILVGNDLFVHDIMPRGSLSKIYSYDSTEFYTKYWKPIVEAVGHVKFDDFGCLLIPSTDELPDVPIDTPETFVFSAVDPEKGQTAMQISFSGSPPTWLIEKSTEPIKTEHVKHAYTELDFVGNGNGVMVICTEPSLGIKEIGHVEQIIPTEQGNQIDVNFGNHIVRLHESKLEILGE